MNHEGPGLLCRDCHGRMDVIDSRRSGVTIRRRRCCRVCKAKVTTFELILPPSHRDAVLAFTATLALPGGPNLPQGSVDFIVDGGSPVHVPLNGTVAAFSYTPTPGTHTWPPCV